jgi:hypothetical protein
MMRNCDQQVTQNLNSRYPCFTLEAEKSRCNSTKGPVQVDGRENFNLGKWGVYVNGNFGGKVHVYLTKFELESAGGAAQSGWADWAKGFRAAHPHQNIWMPRG